MIVKKYVSEIDKATEDRYELFTTEVKKDVDDKDVVLPKSLGIYTLPQLQAQLADIQAKIAAVEEVK
jgi:hypothetical protein